MAVQFKFFMIPASGGAEAEADLNRFLGSRRIVSVEKHFVAEGASSSWCLAVSYLSDSEVPAKAGDKNRVDYKAVLSEEDFTIFARLREWRKTAADAEAVPVYTIFTNDQLAEISKRRAVTKSSLQAIQGIGDARVKKYGEQVIAVVSDQVSQLKTPGSQILPEKNAGESPKDKG